MQTHWVRFEQSDGRVDTACIQVPEFYDDEDRTDVYLRGFVYGMLAATQNLQLQTLEIIEGLPDAEGFE